MGTEQGVTIGRASITRGSSKTQWDEAAARYMFELVNLVTDWAADREDRIDRYYLKNNPDGLELTVVGRAERFDFELNKELAHLTVTLGEKGFPVYGRHIPAGSALAPTGDFPGQILMLVITRHAE